MPDMHIPDDETRKVSSESFICSLLVVVFPCLTAFRLMA